MSFATRRQFLRTAGISAAALPFVLNLQSIAAPATSAKKKQRLLIMFSPNGTVPWDFWPDKTGKDFELKAITQSLKPFQDKLLFVKGLSNRVKGDGDGHMRGIGCMLTGDILLPGNIQGGSDTPASTRRSRTTCRRRTRPRRGSGRSNSASWCPTGPTPGPA
jgi:hypothetical protein